MAHRFVLLLNRYMALIILAALAPVIQQKLGQVDITVAMAALTFHIIHKTTETNKSLLHLLEAIIPGSFAGA